MRRVVITGIGLISPLGTDPHSVWQRILRGEHAVQELEHLKAGHFHTRYGYPISGFDLQDYIKSPKVRRMLGRGDALCVSAAILAVQDAKLSREDYAPRSFALFVGGSKEVDTPPSDMVDAIMHMTSRDLSEYVANVKQYAHPLFFVKGLPGASLFYISEQFDIRGANCYYMGTANVSAAAIASAAHSIACGESSLALAGGFTDPLSWWNYAKVDAIGVLNRAAGEEQRFYRPFDRERQGALLGEGATMLVLEDLEHALKRGARIYGEWLGCGSGMDAESIVRPSVHGRGLQTAMIKALQQSQLDPSDVQYICAHGSATQQGDESEMRALAELFAGQRTAVSSVKPNVGHQFSNAGAFNAYASLMVLVTQTIPHTLHLRQLDGERPLHFIQDEPLSMEVNAVMSIARGLQGENIALVFRRYRE